MHTNLLRNRARRTARHAVKQPITLTTEISHSQFPIFIAFIVVIHTPAYGVIHSNLVFIVINKKAKRLSGIALARQMPPKHSII